MARLVAGALVLLLALAWAAPPAAAAEVKTNATKAPLSASVAAQVAAKPLVRAVPHAMQAPAPAAPESKGSFLGSPTGKIAVVAMAVGLAFAVRSAFKDNDAVHSPVR
jgi:hypothetical protein